MKAILAISAMLCAAAAPAAACTSTGAFGISFGEQAKSTLAKLRQTIAAIVYSVESPEPDARFERYEVNVNSRTGEIFQVVATKRITPKPTSTEFKMSAEDEDAASKRAYSFAASYIASLPKSLQSELVDEYGGSWKGMVSDDVQVHIIGSDFREVTVICQDIRRAGAALKGVW